VERKEGELYRPDQLLLVSEQAVIRVNAMADVLPQPNRNLGIMLMMQQQWDESEAALRRA
jgi:hypothetical protein